LPETDSPPARLPSSPNRRGARRAPRSTDTDASTLHTPPSTDVETLPADEDGLMATALAEASRHRFGEIEVPVTVARALERMGYVDPTEVQAAAIPPQRRGEDLIGEAQSGSGKTADLGIPLV
jgi:superfamily II DNA/RNA helicase